jgi:hypothetical protein
VVAWTAASDAPWLTLSSSSGDTASASSAQTVATSSISGLTAGTYHASIVYTYSVPSSTPGQAPVKSTLMVPATLTVRAPVQDVTLQVNITPAGAGEVSSIPTGTSCGAGCLSFPANTIVQLTASPIGTSNFGGWSGACSVFSNNICNLTLVSDTTVGATFNPAGDFSGSYSGTLSGHITVAGSQFVLVTVPVQFVAQGDGTVSITSPMVGTGSYIVSFPNNNHAHLGASGAGVGAFAGATCGTANSFIDVNMSAAVANVTVTCTFPSSSNNISSAVSGTANRP